MKNFMVVGVSREFMGGGMYVIEAKLRSATGEELYAVVDEEYMRVNRCSLTDDKILRDPDYLFKPDCSDVVYTVSHCDAKYTIEYEDVQGFVHELDQYTCNVEFDALYQMMIAIWQFYHNQELVKPSIL